MGTPRKRVEKPAGWTLIFDAEDPGHCWSLWLCGLHGLRNTRHTTWEGKVQDRDQITTRTYPGYADHRPAGEKRFYYYAVTPDEAETIRFVARHFHTSQAWFNFCQSIVDGTAALTRTVSDGPTRLEGGDG